MDTNTSAIVEELKQIETFANLKEESLVWLIERSEIVEYKEGDIFLNPGEPVDHMFILLEGTVNVSLNQNGELRQINPLEKGAISGLLPYSRMTTTRAIGRAKNKVVALRTHKDVFKDMMREQYELTQSLVHVMTNRVRNFTAFQQQNEKLMALGKLSAGLAHELNNPASAIVRSASALQSHLKALPENFKRVIKIKVTDEDVDMVNHTLFSRLDNPPEPLSLMEKTEREDDLIDWMEEHGIPDPDELAENLLEFGFTVDDLDKVLDQIGADHLPPVIKWINDNLVTERMVSEIADASHRIAELVSSVKSYTHMDQAHARQDVDVRQGLKNTLRMLHHKTNKSTIDVIEDYSETLGIIEGFPGELNQVWTNIIDNAIDAMEEGGKLTIKAYDDGSFVKVEIKDSGPGIPEDVINNVFDPFFTTKGIGKGTGMGLEVSKRIVDKHKGEIKVSSKPGETIFTVCIPRKNS